MRSGRSGGRSGGGRIGGGKIGGGKIGGRRIGGGKIGGGRASHLRGNHLGQDFHISPMRMENLPNRRNFDRNPNIYRGQAYIRRQNQYASSSEDDVVHLEVCPLDLPEVRGWKILNMARAFFPAVSATYIAPFLLFIALSNKDEVVDGKWLGIDIGNLSFLETAATTGLILATILSIPIGIYSDLFYERKRMFKMHSCRRNTGGIGPVLTFFGTFLFALQGLLLHGMLLDVEPKKENVRQISSSSACQVTVISILILIPCFFVLSIRFHRQNQIYVAGSDDSDWSYDQFCVNETDSVSFQGGCEYGWSIAGSSLCRDVYFYNHPEKAIQSSAWMINNDVPGMSCSVTFTKIHSLYLFGDERVSIFFNYFDFAANGPSSVTVTLSNFTTASQLSSITTPYGMQQFAQVGLEGSGSESNSTISITFDSASVWFQDMKIFFGKDYFAGIFILGCVFFWFLLSVYGISKIPKKALVPIEKKYYKSAVLKHLQETYTSFSSNSNALLFLSGAIIGSIGIRSIFGVLNSFAINFLRVSPYVLCFFLFTMHSFIWLGQMMSALLRGSIGHHNATSLGFLVLSITYLGMGDYMNDISDGSNAWYFFGLAGYGYGAIEPLMRSNFAVMVPESHAGAFFGVYVFVTEILFWTVPLDFENHCTNSSTECSNWFDLPANLFLIAAILMYFVSDDTKLEVPEKPAIPAKEEVELEKKAEEVIPAAMPSTDADF